MRLARAVDMQGKPKKKQPVLVSGPGAYWVGEGERCGDLVGAVVEVPAVLIQPGFRPVEGKRVLNLLEPLIQIPANEVVEFLPRHSGPLSAHDAQEALNVSLAQPEAP